MSTFVFIAIAVIVTFIFVVWPVKKAAEWLGAEKTGYGSVLFALFLSVVLGILVALCAIPLAFLGLPGLILLFVFYVYAIGFAYSRALATPFWNAIGIFVVASLIAGVINFGLYIVVKMFEEELTSEQFAVIAEDVCRCGEDPACLREKVQLLNKAATGLNEENYIEETMTTMRQQFSRAMQCANDPGEYEPWQVAEEEEYYYEEAEDSAADTVQDVADDDGADEEETEDVAAAAPPPPPPPEPKFDWLDADTSDLGRYVGKPVSVETTMGTTRKGYLVSMDKDSITVSPKRSGQGMSFDIGRGSIKSMQVYEEIQ